MNGLVSTAIILCFLLGAPQPVFAGAYEDMLAAVTSQDAAKVNSLLQRGMDVNTSDPMGNTLLMLAARNGDAKSLEMLLRNKANVLNKNKYGDSALLLAANRGSLECVRALVEAGADADPDGWTPLIYASFQGHADIVRYLLTLDIDIDAQSDSGMTALMAAVRHDHLQVVRILLEHDADLDLVNQDNQTASDLAKAAGYGQIASILESGKGK